MPKQAKRSRVTIADVAQAAGVSTGTVSRVLNPPADPNFKISEATREQVFAVVDATNRWTEARRRA